MIRIPIFLERLRSGIVVVHFSLTRKEFFFTGEPFLTFDQKETRFFLLPFLYSERGGMEEAERINNVEGDIYTFPAPHRRMGHGGMIDRPSTHITKK